MHCIRFCKYKLFILFLKFFVLTVLHLFKFFILYTSKYIFNKNALYIYSIFIFFIIILEQIQVKSIIILKPYIIF